MKLQTFLLLSYAIFSMYAVNSAEGIKRKSYKVYYKWKQIDFNFCGAPATREEMIAQQTYIPKNVMIASPKISGDRMFLNVPRLLPGVPSTLNWVAYKKKLGNGIGPLLTPYPSWEMQEIGNCHAIQSVLATEIDQWNRLWIFDSGRLNIRGPDPVKNCPPKLILMDLKTDTVIYTYIFPADVVTRNNSFLGEANIACTSPEDCRVYISDITDARIIMYDHYRRRSWYVTHPSMEPDPRAANMTILGKTTYNPYGITGLALTSRSQNHDALYYAPMAGFTIYKVSTKILLSAPCGSTLQDKDVLKVVTKIPKGFDGMTIDGKGRLYYGSLEDNAVLTLNTHSTTLPKANVLAQNNVDLQWPNMFGFDNDNQNLVLITCRFQDLGGYNLSDYNFRVLRFHIDTRSYIY